MRILKNGREKAKPNTPTIPIAEIIDDPLKVFLSFIADKFTKAK